MKLVDALRQEDRLTENGMVTNSTSLNANVDLFYNIGAMRGQERSRLIQMFSAAFGEDPLTAIKILFWSRDVRGGAGERQIFRDIAQYLANTNSETLEKNLHLIPEYGRWDDLLVFEGTLLQDAAFDLIQDALLKDQNGLCAKWMPRKGMTAVVLRNHMGLTPKLYRKVLVTLTNVVEQQMCAKEWNQIEFSKLPSLASARYQNAFIKNAKDSYLNYLDALTKGEAKINAGAVYPYDVIKSVDRGNNEAAAEQWKALPNYLEGSTDMVLPLVDVSGSMSSVASGSTTCMDIAVSLGLYIAERNEGPFKDSFLTFSANPELQVLRGDNLIDRLGEIYSANWGMNTNLEASFKLILDQAIKHSVSQDEMPDKILILSDMQFDEATSSTWNEDVPEWNPTAQQMIEKMYLDAGYKMPKIVYWNLQSRRGDVPVAFDKTGTALISGFSPAIMTSVLGAEEFTPISIMNATILGDRYKEITL
jgi:hypothetical protein